MSLVSVNETSQIAGSLEKRLSKASQPYLGTTAPCTTPLCAAQSPGRLTPARCRHQKQLCSQRLPPRPATGAADSDWSANWNSIHLRNTATDSLAVSSATESPEAFKRGKLFSHHFHHIRDGRHFDSTKRWLQCAVAAGRKYRLACNIDWWHGRRGGPERGGRRQYRRVPGVASVAEPPAAVDAPPSVR